MLKANLKEKWGKYCDTDKLVDDVMALLTKYRHLNTEHGVCVLLDTYFTNKQGLIDMFKGSSNYIGDMRIVVDIELQRGTDMYELRRFCDTFIRNVDAKSVILKTKDEDGKTIVDYLKIGVSAFKAKDLLSEDIRSKLNGRNQSRNKFNSEGYTIKSAQEYSKICDAVYRFRYNPESVLKEDIARWLEQNKINGKYSAGMKTSRAFNRLCTEYKIHELPDYNKLFARYSDMVSGLKRKMKFFISLNPLDYLTMSFGNSWASCHTIDKRNVRGMPNDYSGAYCGGTVSYMLDKTSIITYVHDAMPESYEDGKVYRNMFHYADGALIQGRVYPQGNDGATDLYTTFRNVVQKELSQMLGLPNNMWTKKRDRCGMNTRTSGVHYADYLHYNNCNMSYPSEMPDAKNVVVDIGHVRICPKCGTELGNGYSSDRLTHSTCPV